MDNKIIFEQFPGDFEKRKIKEKQDKIFLIVILLLLVIVLSVLSTLLNLKLLEG